MRTLTLLVLIALAGCDKAPESTAPAATSGAAAEAAKAADSIDDLLAKLPEAAPVKEVAPVVQSFGRFGTNGEMPGSDGALVEVDAKAVSELNIVASYRAQSAFAERQIDPKESVIVQFGGEETDGLLLTIRYQGKSVSRNIVPASSGPELVSNFDHTVDRLLDQLGVPRKPR